MIRKWFKFYGSVQGVGFRWRAKYCAGYYGITGWAANCSDGSVEAEFQGKETDIDSALLMIEKGTFINIENIETKIIPLKEHETLFEIR